MLKFWKGACVQSWKGKLCLVKFERLCSNGFISVMTHFELPWDSISQSDVIKEQYVDESSFLMRILLNCAWRAALSSWPSSLCKHTWASVLTNLSEQKRTELKQKKSVKSTKWCKTFNHRVQGNNDSETEAHQVLNNTNEQQCTSDVIIL